MNRSKWLVLLQLLSLSISILLPSSHIAIRHSLLVHGFLHPTLSSSCRPKHRTWGRHTVIQWDSKLTRDDVRVATATATAGKTSATTTYYRDSSLPSPSKVIGKIAFLLPSILDDTSSNNNYTSHLLSKFGIHSPVDRPSWQEAAQQLAKKATWFSENQLEIIFVSPAPHDVEGNNIPTNQEISVFENVNMLIAMGLSSSPDLQYAHHIFERRRRSGSHHDRFSKCQFALDCATVEEREYPFSLATTVGPYDERNPVTHFLSMIFPWTDVASGRRFQKQMQGLFDRWTTDDFTVALMLFLNRFSGHAVDWVKDSADATWEKGPIRNAQELFNMATKCGDCLTNCLQDPTCKTCLEKLTELDTRDQAASYRTIVSYESKALQEFSFCVFQKHNVFQCDSTIPTIPQVEPMTTWRNQPLTQDVARSLLIGHLDDDGAPEGSLQLDVSWKVACGANVAYDQFPSQNQLFYHAAKGRDMWYDPVFRVQTLDGRHVWCKRHYRVRDGPIPGTFRLSVLDNGVTSNEFWTIVGCADDLSWIAFHYAGAASTVGQRYLGGLLCTADGTVPSSLHQQPNTIVWNVFRNKAGIEPWELFVVDNDPESEGAILAGPPPLDYYRKEVLARKVSELQ